jgi:hypothetical protein
MVADMLGQSLDEATLERLMSLLSTDPTMDEIQALLQSLTITK